ncbi:beta strand repeat-containing protein [Tsuneonella sp. HG249]
MDLHDQEPTQFGEEISANLQDAGNVAAAGAGRGAAQILMPDASGVVVLPAGTELGDIRIEGRDLVVIGADGVRYIIPEGAIVVPQLVVGDVVIPPLNLAALLIGNEPQPAAGNPQSSGGNFASAVGPLQAAYGLGDLLPYTELSFPEPEEQEIIPGLIDRDPLITVITPDQPAGATNATATVAEAGLPARPGEPAGSNSAATTETTSGTFVINSPDGIATLTINGTAFTGAGQTFTSPRGTLQITSYDPATGAVGFTYSLADNLAGATLADQFTVTVTDTDGDVAIGTLTVNVTDDGPTARNDTDSVPESSFNAQTGNVITGAGTTSGAAGVDTLGADNASLTRIASNNVAANADTTFDASGNLQVAGQYGTLLIKADGSYSFTRAAGTSGGVSDVFTYTLTDSDGSASTATLTIAIADATPVITSVPPASDFAAGTLVFEAGLPSRASEAPGTDALAPTETTSGTVTFAGGDGPLSAAINGVAAVPGATVTVPGVGTLTVLTFNPATGVFTYSFTLADNTAGDNTSVSFNIVVTDVDGDTAPGTFTIAIRDDSPTAVNDSAAQSAENAPVTVNLLANDTQGADTVQASTVTVVADTLTGAGTLTNNANGTVTYTPGPGETGTVSFDYTITDGDGDVSRATATIVLLADSTPTLGVAGDSTVDEAALGARPGEPTGSNAASTDETAVGTIAVTTGNDTLASLVIDGVNVTNGGTVTTAKGVLTVSVAGGAYSYSYTLNDNTLADPDSDTFNLFVTDSDGDTASATLVIAIADDAPSASDDAGALAAGQYDPITGSVIANDTPGADGIVVTGYSGVTSGAAGSTIDGQYGTLTIAADGTFSYTRDPGTPGGVTDSFSYTVRDGDLDTATANLVITIADSGTTLDLPIAGTPGSTQVLEEGLSTGSNAATDGEFANGTFSFAAPDGPAVVTIDGTQITAVGQTISGDFGTLEITSIAPGVIGYRYELTTNTDGDTTFDSFAVLVVDQDGDNTAGTLRIDIVDDVPTAIADADSVKEDGPLTATGNVISGQDVLVGPDANATDGVADVRGADNANVSTIEFNPAGGGAAVPGTLGGGTAGAYGTLTLNADGSYTYALNNANPIVQGLDSNDSLTETFTYTLADGDGDPSQATLTITINGDDDGITITGLNVGGGEERVFENDLADGSSPSAAALTQSGSFTVNGVDGIATIVIDGVTVFGPGASSLPATTSNAAYGTLTITSVTPTIVNGEVVSAVVNYEYTLNDNTLAHTGALDAELTDSFQVSVTDSDGSTANDTLDVVVVDDVPTARADGTFDVAEQTPLVIDVFANDTAGADGVALATAVALATGPTKGTVVYNANGTFTYMPNTGADGADSFTYTITDGDGDTSTATVTLNLLSDSTPSFKTSTNLAVDEDGLPNANVDAAPLQGSPAEIDGGENLTDSSGVAVFDFKADVPLVLAGSGVLVDTGALDGQLVTLDNQNVVFALEGGALVGRAGSAAGAEIIRITLTSATAGPGASEVSYTYSTTLSQPVKHAVTGSEDIDTLSGVTIEVTDRDGDKTTGTFTVTVRDDVPSLDVTKGADAAILLTTQDAQTDGNPTDQDTAVATVGAVTAGFAGVFGLDFDKGADGGATPTLSYVLNVTNSVSGLSSHGVAINLYKLADGTIVGSTAVTNPNAINGTAVFSVSVDADGTVTLTQYQQIDHAAEAPPSATPFEDQTAKLADGLITLTASSTLTDGDGDVASNSETVDIGDNLRFADDGPVLTNVAAGGSVSIDETAAGENFPAPISATSANAVITATSAFGADGPFGNTAAAGTTYGITINGGGTTPFTTATGGFAITLHQVSASVIEGRYTDAALATQVAFTLTIGTDGNLTVQQRIAIEHTIDGNTPAAYDDALVLTSTGAAGGTSLITASITLKDFDGDTATGTAAIGGNITFRDDGVDAVLDTDTVAAGTNGPETGNLLANDYLGADGASITSVTGNAAATPVAAAGSTAVQGAYGVLTISADGTYSYARTPGLGGGQNDVFTYTLADNDGDFDTATLTISIGNVAPIAGTAQATVDDEGLAGGITGLLANGDIDANNPVGRTADADQASTEAVFKGTLGGTAGDGTSTFFFASALAGTTQMVGQEMVTYSVGGTAVTGGGLTLTATGPRGVLFTVTITNPATGAYTVTLADNVLHANAGLENGDIDINVPYQMRDADGQLSTLPGSLSILFDDDMPTLTLQTGLIATSKTAVGTLSLQVGADNQPVGTNLDTFVNAALTGGTVGTGAGLQNITVTSAAQLPSTTNTPNVVTYAFTFTYDSDSGPAVATASNGGTLTLNTTTGQYTVVLNNSVGYTQTVQTAQATTITPYQAESPADDQGAQAEFAVSQLAPGFFVQFYGDHNNLSYADNANSPFLGSPGYVSVSGSANGVNSDTIQQNDVLNLDFYVADPGGDSTPEQARAFADAIFIQIDNFGNDEDGMIVLKLVDPANPGAIIYRTFQADHGDFFTAATGSPAGYTFNFVGYDGVLVVEANDYRLAGDPVPYVIAGVQYVVSTEGTNGTAYDLNGAVGAGGGLIDLTPNAFANGDITDDNDVTKIVNIGLKLTSTTPQPLTLNFSVTATDADGDTVTTPASVTFPASVMPVAFDMDGDGVEFLGTDAGVAYDYGSGPSATAWVAPDDAILVHDANGNGLVDGPSEFVFGSSDTTDLAALAARYGATLDSNDADFAKFGAWQDADSDGVSDAGEFTSLTEIGIVSLSLVSDGQAYSAANGQVSVSGSTVYTRADGSTGIAADAAFATEARAAQRTAELVTTTAVAGAMLAAAGTTMPLAAQETHDRELPQVETNRIAVDEWEVVSSTRSEAGNDLLASAEGATIERVETTAHFRGETVSARLIADEFYQDAEHAANRFEMLDAGPRDSVAGVSLFGSFGDEGMMQALLSMQGPQLAGAEMPAVDVAAISAALSDFSGEALVHAVVDHFAPNADGPSLAAIADNGGFNLLTQDLAGSALATRLTAMPDVADDAHALLVAQA